MLQNIVFRLFHDTQSSN